jgi:flagellar operon protein
LGRDILKMPNPKINNILIPNITKLPSKTDVDLSNKLVKGQTSEFKNILDSNLEESEQSPLLEIPKGLHLSTHAMRRLQERNLSLDKDEYSKLMNAIDKLKLKGGQDSLVITNKAAYIVDVPKNTIVTAIDKDNIGENVFTKIDSTILMN